MKVDERLRGATRGKNPKYTMSNPILYEDFEEIEEWLKDKKENKNAWKVTINDLKNYDLDLENPLDEKKFETIQTPNKLLDDIIKNEEKMKMILNEIQDLIKIVLTKMKKNIKYIMMD